MTVWFFFPGGKIRASGAAFVCEVACRRRANGFQGPGAEPPGDPAVGGIPPGTGDPEQREGREAEHV